MNIISYFQAIIKGRRVQFNSLTVFLSMLFLVISCKETSTQQPETATEISSPTTSVVVSVETLTLKPNLGLLLYQEQPFTGVSEKKYENGVVAETIQYVNGRKHGERKKWFQNGLLSFEARYADGKQHGTSKTWWRNGNLRSISQHVHGVVDGIQEQWYITGEKFKRRTIVNGKEEGLQQAWRKNGKLFNNYEAKNGRFFGLKRAGLCYELQNEIVQTN